MTSIDMSDVSEVHYITSENENLVYPFLLSEDKPNQATEAIVSSTSDMIFSENPMISIIIQPTDKHRFRYKSESGSHGGITGEGHSRGKKQFPTVELQNYDMYLDRKIFIKVSLYTADVNSRPHVLELAGKTCKNGECYQKLDNKTRRAKFQGISIVNKTKYEVLEILRERKKCELKVSSLNEALLEETQEEAKNLNLNAVKLCFEAVFEDNFEPVPGRTIILSNTIFNLKSTFTGDLRIVRLSMCNGKSSGDEDVILLCNKIKKDEIQIKFIEKDESENILWTATAHFNPVDVHHQVAIPFKTPKYEGDSLKEGNEVVVWIQLFRKSDEKYGEPVQFTYNCNENENPKKRKMCHTREVVATPQGFQMSSIFTNDAEHSLSAADLTPCGMFDNLGTINFDDVDSINSDSCNLDDINPSYQEMVMKDAAPANMDEHPIFSFVLDQPILQRLDQPTSQRVVNQSITQPIFRSHTSKSTVSFEEQFNDLSLSDVKVTREKTPLEKFHLNVANLSKYTKVLYYPSKPIQDAGGNSVLHLAIMFKIPDLMHGALNFVNEDLVNYKNLNNETPLHLASCGNYAKVLRLLLLHGGDPYLPNGDGNNCFHLASISNFIECMRVLLSSISATRGNASSDINSLNFDGLSPLHLSIIHNSKECMKLLLDAKADVNIAENKSGRSPLHLAVELRSSLVHDLLLQPEIDVDREDYRGFTAFQFACERHNVPHENFSFETSSDKQQIAVILMKFFKEEDDESDSSYLSASESITESDNEDERFQESVEKFLNSNKNWKKLGPLVDMDEESLEILAGLEKNPAKRLMKMIQEANLQEGYLKNTKKTLLCILEKAGFGDAIKNLKSLNNFQ